MYESFYDWSRSHAETYQEIYIRIPAEDPDCLYGYFDYDEYTITSVTVLDQNTGKVSVHYRMRREIKCKNI